MTKKKQRGAGQTEQVKKSGTTAIRRWTPILTKQKTEASDTPYSREEIDKRDILGRYNYVALPYIHTNTQIDWMSVQISRSLARRRRAGVRV